jgi:hypothetical protein
MANTKSSAGPGASRQSGGHVPVGLPISQSWPNGLICPCTASSPNGRSQSATAPTTAHSPYAAPPPLVPTTDCLYPPKDSGLDGHTVLSAERGNRWSWFMPRCLPIRGCGTSFQCRDRRVIVGAGYTDTHLGSRLVDGGAHGYESVFRRHGQREFVLLVLKPGCRDELGQNRLLLGLFWNEGREFRS